MANITYRRNMTRQEFALLAGPVAYKLVTFAFGLYVIMDFGSFGEKVICPLSAAMWCVGDLVALLIPSQREEVCRQTLKMNLLYYGFLFGLKYAIGMASGISSEMIAATYDYAIPTSTGNAIPGYLQNILYFTSFLTPGSFLVMQLKRFSDFRKNQSLQKSFGRTRSLRNSGKEHTRLTR